MGYDKIQTFNQVNILGVIDTFEVKTSRAGKDFGNGVLEDANGDKFPFTCFGSSLQTIKAAYEDGSHVILNGRLDADVYESCGQQRTAIKFIVFGVQDLGIGVVGGRGPSPKETPEKSPAGAPSRVSSGHKVPKPPQRSEADDDIPF